MFGIKVVDLDSKKEIENNSIISTLIKNKKLSVGAYCENLIQKNDYEGAKKLVEISKITITNIDDWKESKKNPVETKDGKSIKDKDNTNKPEKVMDLKKEIKDVDSSTVDKTTENNEMANDKLSKISLNDELKKLFNESSEKQNFKNDEKEE